MKRSILYAAIILAVIVAYFGVRMTMRGSVGLNGDTAEAATQAPVPEALVVAAVSQPHMMRITARGRTAPDKSVTVKSGTSGTVTSTPVREGTFVRAGTLLCGLDVEARSARLQEAEAMRESARIDFEAAATLAARGLAPANREAAARATLDAAEAAVNAARVELDRTRIRAPFDGIFERRMAETGDFLSPGAACGLLVDLDPVIVAAEVTEAQAGLLSTGMAAEAELADGRRFPAKLRFVARTASAQTRTFPIEAELETGDAVVAAGVTASLSIPAQEVSAALVQRSLLTLADTGQLGVRIVREDNTVAFMAVRVIDETPEGAWVTGLPERVTLVAKGQDYLNDGVRVRPVEQGPLP
ncbi:efflux RND transporter periplasmic adaptor subunit [Hyphomonas sp.]|uniref:efflux RND transporter periplasmic adaptor subunit n=1 Tax=Hyphomonas sp. TaxID=87 RepID=UPI003919AB60